MRKVQKVQKLKVEAVGTYNGNVLVEVEKKGVPREKWLLYNFDVYKHFDVIKPYLKPLTEEDGTCLEHLRKSDLVRTRRK